MKEKKHYQTHVTTTSYSVSQTVRVNDLYIEELTTSVEVELIHSLLYM